MRIKMAGIKVLCRKCKLTFDYLGHDKTTSCPFCDTIVKVVAAK
jgi:hypothetical protein